nr:hypothetical protein [Tanacetum cinerariifolium]
TQDNVDARKEVFDQHYIVLPLWSSIFLTFKSSYDKATDDKPTDDTGSKTVKEPINKEDQAYRDELDKLLSQEKEASSRLHHHDVKRIFRSTYKNKGSGEKGGSTARPEFSAATPSTPPTTTTIFGDEDLTIAQTLIKLRSEKAKERGVSFRHVEEPPRLTRSTTTLQHLPTIDPKDKGKGVLVEEEPEKLEKVKRMDQGLAQIESDADLAQRIYKEELAEMDADHELAVRMIHEEQEKYTIDEWARLLEEYFERREKHLAAERAEAIRNKPPTRTQVRNKMITYLKHMDSEKEEKKSTEPESKGKKGKRIKRFADSTLKQKSSKKQKMKQEQESTKNKEETADPEILSTKYPIVDWKSHILENVDKEDLHVYKIIRANGNISYHKSLSSMLRKFDRQDLVDLYRLVMKKFEDNNPEGYNLLL